MAGKADFTADEWALLCKSPILAALVVVASSPSGPFGVIKEMFAVGKLIAETKTKGGGDALVGAVVADVTSREGMEQAKPTEIQGKKPDEARTYALDQLKRVSALLDQKAGVDATGFKQWLQEVAVRVANASKEGGFLGFGGTLVSEQEQRALADTSAALGVAKA
jgi:hypothetical protein